MEDSQNLEKIRIEAEKGNADSQYLIGEIYRKGDGISVDYKEALKWYLMAAEQEHVRSQFTLGVLYSLGVGVTQNVNEAIKWYRLAAEQGDEQARTYLDAVLEW